MTHPLATKFAGAQELSAELAAREPDKINYWTQTRDLIDRHHPKRLNLTVEKVIDETATTKTFRLRRPDGQDLPPFLAGQYVSVFADNTNRAYAMSSSPTERDHYDLTIRRVPGGRISNLLLDSVSAGDNLTTSGPQGTFHHNPLFHGDDVVFIAGGSGVVPAMSMIRGIAAEHSDLRLHLIYGSRDDQDIIFGKELDELAARTPNVTVEHVIGGFITAERISTAVGDLAGRTVYVCGPQVLYDYALEQLAALGHPRHRIRFEANGAPAAPAEQKSWPPGADPDTKVTVTIDGRTFSTPTGRPLLDALEDNGIRPEAACRSGECSMCRVRVLKGEVHQAEEAKPRLCDGQYGYVHSCVAYPISNVELEL